jgi:putative colanic acid biosynthesis UDP-glucose lipid carrier transferase
VDLGLVERFGEAWSAHAVRPVGELSGYVRDNDIQDVWIAVPLAETALLEQALEALRDTLVDVHVVPDLHQYRMLNQNISEWAGLPVISLSGTPMTGAEMRLKTALDYAGATALVLVLSPLLLLIAVAIRAGSRGPVLFRQPRHGLGGETITVLKFRTMHVHRERGGEVKQARPDDDRVTTVGRWLRRTSLDELPQLFNVLAGQMSLVGPRPHATAHNRFFRERIPRYMLRHKVKPGITGWAQVNGYRGLTDTDEKMTQRIEHDLWYIQNWSLWLDIRILLMTPLAMIHRNAF